MILFFHIYINVNKLCLNQIHSFLNSDVIWLCAAKPQPMTHAFCLAVFCFNALAFFVSITCVDLVSHFCFVRLNNGFLFCFVFNLLCVWMLRQNVTQDHKINEPFFVSLITCYHNHLQFSWGCMISTRSNFPATEQTSTYLRAAHKQPSALAARDTIGVVFLCL